MRCLMPGARPSVKPLSAGESSGSSSPEEVSHLEKQSQRQLEEDVARIFDESIYSDLEVVCGKLKILTHSCILKARTHKFYHKLEAILHVNIGRNTFDEIHSFISDAYTECNIKKQEKEIIEYLNENLISGKNGENSSKNKPEEKDEPEVYSTPNCVSPEEKSHQKILSSSPSKELTKEYYALVPIDGNVLDKELIEQDALSNAFQSITNSQFGAIKAKQNIQCVKPTSLCLNSSHVPKINKHSNSCDILKKSDSNSDSIKKAIGFDEKKTEANKSSAACNKNSNLPETSADKVLDPTYTPDSLITDEPSSSSDYLSAAYAVSPGTVFSSGFSQLNVGENATKMDNIVTITDSGLENSGMLESLNSHKDVTLTDVSLTESNLHDLHDDDNNCQESASNALEKNHVHILRPSTSLNSPTSGTSTDKGFNERKSTKSSLIEISSTSSKEEKQRQNEEIVILETSSLSSETGSWETVFPPKLPDKDICERFITSERKCALELETETKPHNNSNVLHEIHDDLRLSLVQQSPYKSASCFIDAASLADEGDDVLFVQNETKDTKTSTKTDMIEQSIPIPCTLNRDLSPNDWSGSNDNEDSLEQDNKDPDLIQKDLSVTIFEMTPVTEDSLFWNACGTTDTDGKNVTHDTILSGNGFIQGGANTVAGNFVVEEARPQATHDPVLAGNGFIQIRSNSDGSTFAVEQNRPRATHDRVLAGNGFIQIRSNSDGSTFAVEQNRPQATHDTVLAGNGFIQIRSNSDGSTFAVDQNRPRATHDRVLAGNGFIQIRSNSDGSTFAVEQNRPQATHDTVLAGNGFIQIRSNSDGSTFAVEQNRPQATHDPVLAGNGFIQIRSNSDGSTFAVEQNRPQAIHDPVLAGNGFIQIRSNSDGSTFAVEQNRPQAIHDPVLAGNGFIQIRSNSDGSTFAVEQNRPRATHDPVLAGNGFIQIRSNSDGSTFAVEQNRPQAINDPVLAGNGFIQIRSNSDGSTFAVEQNRPRATHDPVLAGNGFIQIRSNSDGSTFAVEQNRPRATHDPVLAGNGFIQIRSNSDGSTFAVEQNRPQAIHDPVLAGNGFIQIRSNSDGSTFAVEQNRPQATHDPVLAGNGFIQIRSNSDGSTFAVEQNRPNDPILAGNGVIQVCANTVGGTVKQKYQQTTHDPLEIFNNSFLTTSTFRDALSTPNNSIVSVNSLDSNMYESEGEHNTLGRRHDNNSLTSRQDGDANTPVNLSSISEPNYLTLCDSIQSNTLGAIREIENIPIVSGAYMPEPEDPPDRPPRAPSNSSFWVVDMSSTPKSDITECSVKVNNPIDQHKEELRPASKSTNSSETYKSRSSVDSDSSEKSTHKFYIDLTTLPDALTTEQNQDKEEGNEKKNIFSMFIGLGEKSSTAKEMPVRFSSPHSTKKITTESKSSFKGSNTSKACDTKTTSCANTSSNYTDESILFEKLESLCADPSISISEILTNNIPLNKESPDVPEVTNIKRKDNDLKDKVIQEETAAGEPLDLFVKLSDLDKPAPKTEPVAITGRKESHERMTRSIPDNNWRESSQTISLRSSEIISSFHSENALSLNRLFPHLKNDFSRSMPGSLSSRTRSPLRLGLSSSPGDIEECQASDVSEMSSVQSSFCRSVVENSTTEETEQTSSLISNCQSRLGQDLLRMFLEEIAPDVIVEVSGRRIKAHKCILSSRCQYFAGILSGGWVESAGNVISLPPFSFSVVHFALCHIYSGVSVIPDSISVVELATLADMLGLEGLKEGIMFMLKAKYCHHFHKPCSLCTAGVLECFPLAAVYGLDDLYRKCLRWITKHFHRVWPTKAFATLPFELIEKCCQEHIMNLTVDNFVETVFGCGIAVSSLATSRWAGVVARMCRRLVNAAAQFAAAHLCEVLQAMSGEPTQAPKPAIHALQECVAAAIEWSPPEQTCRAYHLLYALLKELRAHHHPRPDLIADGAPAAPLSSSLLTVNAPSWRLLCEGTLVRYAPRVVPTAAFADLPAELRNRLRDLGCISYGAPAVAAPAAGWSPRAPRRPRAAPAPSPPARRPRAARAPSPPPDMDQVRACFVPYSPKPQPRLGSVDSLTAREKRAHDLNRTLPTAARSSKPRDDRSGSKMNRTFPPCVRTTKAQEERAKYNSTKTNQSVERAAVRPPRVAYEHAKPRYMEPRQPRDKPPAPAHAPAPSTSRKPQPRMVSSSDSSRNSSPVLRGARARSSRDSLPPPPPPAAPAPLPRPRTADISADSRNEAHNADKYATYTKAKHNTEGSVEAVLTPTARSQAAAPPGTSRTPTTKPQQKTTKIPVYLNKTSKSSSSVSAPPKDRRSQGDKPTNSNLSPVPPRNKPNERKPSGSLMNATKSSQAKVVSKPVKETTPKHASKHDRTPEPSTSRCKNEARSPTAEIPVMERSGTFLKDEPMFGDKTTNIDIDE